MNPGERTYGRRRLGWVNGDKMTGAGWARVGRRLPTGGAPRVMDLDASSRYPIVLGQVDGRTMISWPLTVRERPPSPHRTMFMDERHHDAGGWLHRDDGPAIVFADGARVWMQHGALHRAGGPATEGSGGSPAWRRHGGRIESPEWACTTGRNLPEQLMSSRPRANARWTTRIVRAPRRPLSPSAQGPAGP